MTDAEKMARAFRTALHQFNDDWDDFDQSGTAGILVDYTAAAQILLDAGWRPPSQQETTVNETTHIGGWPKLEGSNLISRSRDRDTDDAEATAINGIVEFVVGLAVFDSKLPVTGIAETARERLAPLGITAETLRPKRKTVRAKCPLHAPLMIGGIPCKICGCTGEYDAELVEDNNAERGH